VSILEALDSGHNMSLQLTKYESMEEFLKDFDRRIGDVRRRLSGLIKLLEEARVKADKEKKIMEVLRRVGASGKGGVGTTVAELRGGVKVVVNPDAVKEVEVLEGLAGELNKLFSKLQEVRKSLEVFSGLDVEASVSVVWEGGLPKVVLVSLE